MPVTMRDVAAKAGVSPVVVSRVLHGKAKSIRVSEATAERVREAAAELGYRCNIMARNFRAQQTFSIGVLHGVGVTRPKLEHGSRYFAALMDGIVEGAFRHAYSVTLCPKLLGESPDDAMSDGRFDGLVWYSSVSSDESRQTLANCRVPLVLLHAHTSDFAGRHPSVICDNDQGIGLAIEHLATLGHRRIAFAMDVHPTNVESHGRLAAFRKHMESRGLACGDGDILEIGWSRTEISDYFAHRRKHTAIVAHNETLAAEFLKRAVDFEVSIPDQLSVVGFDSTSFCDELQPRLTCVSQPLAAMGSKAIDCLIARIRGGEEVPAETVFNCGFDIRESTAPVR